ncbi:hypothetical protein HaLaN_17182 [Haematococcus lacustris]|uniref:Uncharacterized protein n=1 Tax=Haematococcus lacustris TaxID=44745 RepID=A0A699ZFW0_HAELA|nr:hypothetical protein HaLaN_17182 [Haematococcus lacustris]
MAAWRGGRQECQRPVSSLTAARSQVLRDMVWGLLAVMPGVPQCLMPAVMPDVPRPGQHQHHTLHKQQQHPTHEPGAACWTLIAGGKQLDSQALSSQLTRHQAGMLHRVIAHLRACEQDLHLLSRRTLMLSLTTCIAHMSPRVQILFSHRVQTGAHRPGLWVAGADSGSPLVPY